jgi:hypothetical protein
MPIPKIPTPRSTAPRSPLAVGALLVAALALPGCDSDVVYGPGEPSDDRTAWGDYVVRRANAQPLPALVRRGTGSRVEVLSGSLRLERDGDCWFTVRLRVTVLGTTSTSTETEHCRWSQYGADLRLRWDDRSVGTGRYEGGARVTLYAGDDTFELAI